jgi:hypothetical protein
MLSFPIGSTISKFLMSVVIGTGPIVNTDSLRKKYTVVR